MGVYEGGIYGDALASVILLIGWLPRVIAHLYVKETEKGEAWRYQGISSILLEGLKSKGTSPIEMEIKSEIVNGCGVSVDDAS